MIFANSVQHGHSLNAVYRRVNGSWGLVENKGQINYAKSLAVKRRGGKEKRFWGDSTKQIKGLFTNYREGIIGRSKFGI